MTYLEIRNLSKTFSESKILDNLDLNIYKGEIIGILGPSGCGKTTLLKVILGIHFPDKGSVIKDGNSLISIPIGDRQIGYIPQTLSLFPHLNVYDNVAFGLRIKKVKSQLIAKRVKELLHLANISHLSELYPHEISGGQKQRVALIRALALEPELLLLDEPLSSLDFSLSRKLRWDLRRIIKESKTTAIYVTHNPEEATSVCDRLAIMENGKIIAIGTFEDLINKSKSFKTHEILGLPNIIPVKNIEKTDDGDWIYTDSFKLLKKNSKDKNIRGLFLPSNELFVSKKENDNLLSFTAKFLGKNWIGRRKNHTFLVEGKYIIMLENNPDNELSVGGNYFITINREKVVLL